IYACCRYPVHEKDYFDHAVREARWQMRRLARHASLVVVCGNNEIETGHWNWGWEAGGLQSPDHGFFHITLARILEQENRGVFYWPSSPHSPPDPLTGATPNPEDERTGDQHPWSLGFYDTDFRKYRRMVCRFPNEGGVLGPPSLPTLLECLPEGHRHRGSFAWLLHENSVAYWSEPSAADAQIEQWTGVSVESLSLEDFVYWGGLVQGEGLREYCENFRRRMFESSAAVFWMFNDTWPAVRSWTPVDYRLRRTPSFHPVRRAMQPVAVVLSEEDGRVRAHGINDSAVAVEAALEWGVFGFDGSEVMREQAAVSLPANCSTVLAEFEAAVVGDDSRNLAYAILHDGRPEAPISRARLVRELPAAWKLEKPRVSVEWDGKRAVFSSPVFVWGVCLDLVGELPLADNFFDLFPNRPYGIEWPFAEAPRVLRCGFRERAGGGPLPQFSD
ncbi:MAG: hypothetical protein N2322_03630, partial [Terrimicrobiaceae bacterium]|nr:hypothetical protein [Terrimicrobiaceae bacterium]